MKLSATLIVALLLGLLAVPLHATSLTDEVSAQLRSHLPDGVTVPTLWLSREVPLVAEQIPDYYRRRQYRPVWVGDLGLTRSAHGFVEVLRNSTDYGLCAEDYGLDLIEPLLSLEGDSLRTGVLFDPHYLAVLDLLLSEAYFRFAADLYGGRRQDQLTRRLDRELARGDWHGLFAQLAPNHPGYLRLLEQRDRLAVISAFGGWPKVEMQRVLRSGDRDTGLARLRHRMLLSGDLKDPRVLDEAGYGPMTVAGVRHFQQRHGLDADGVLGPLTLAEMNVPVETRIEQIELNLQRWRQLPHDLGPRHIRVNVANFKLEVFEGDTPVLSMPVVVGTPFRQTPMFSAEMRYIEFAPYWYVPSTILREDKLPKILRDPGWLNRNHYEILAWLGGHEQLLDPRRLDWSGIDSHNFPGALRMKPGPWNPLGRVKFIFPNRYAVYLHDTNEHNLFNRDERLFSSGCIRIERPLDLAQYLLEHLDGWDCERIEAAMNAGEPLKVDLPEHLPVHLLYWTAWVEPSGELQFRPDFYLRDLDQQLAGGSPSEADADVALLRAGP